MANPFQELERAVLEALRTYSNVHRGSGHHSMVSTRLYAQAREIVLAHLGLDSKKYVVVFCTPRRATVLETHLAAGSYRCVSSRSLGLPLGVRAVAVERKALPKGIPFETGGGTARLVGPAWVIWEKGPERFEAGTPAVINVIAFARALQIVGRYGADVFQNVTPEQTTADAVPGTDELDECSGWELLGKLRETLIGRGARVPTLDGERSYVNLDNGASTPTFQPIWDAVRWSWHQPIHACKGVIHNARSICAEVLGAPLASHEVIFTSNTTEAINLAAESLGKETEPDIEVVVLNTLLEHNSNELPWRATPGLSLIRLPVDDEGFVNLTELDALLHAYNQAGMHGRKRIKLVAVSGASNVLGVYNHVAEVSQIVHRHGARLLVDAAQWVAHRKVEMQACGIDYLAFSGHKLYAPFGTGVLLVRKGLLAFSPTELEQIHASGEENVGGIIALAKALELLHRIGFDTIREHEQALTKQALCGLGKHARIKIYGIKDPDSPRFFQKGGVIAFEMKGMLPSRVARALAERGGIGVRYGCHCAHLLIKRLLRVPPWAERLQFLIVALWAKLTLPGLVRVSFGIENTAADIDSLIQVLDEIARKPRTKNFARRMDAFLCAAIQRVYSLISSAGTAHVIASTSKSSPDPPTLART